MEVERDLATNEEIRFLFKPLSKKNLFDKLNKTVEDFSHKTMTLLSWMDELEEISCAQTPESPFYDSNACRKDEITNHIERVYVEIDKTADKLAASLPDEKDTIEAVLAKLRNRCRKLDVKRVNISQDSTSEMSNSSVSESKSPSNCVSSTSNDESEKIPGEITSRVCSEIPKFSERSKDTTNSAEDLANENTPFASRRNLSKKEYWREFQREYKAIMNWLQQMESVITWAEKVELPMKELQNIFKKYFHQFILSKPKRECLNIKANFIGTMFSELQKDIDDKMNCVDDLWRQLMMRLSYYILPTTEKHSDEKNRRLSQHSDSGFFDKTMDSAVDEADQSKSSLSPTYMQAASNRKNSSESVQSYASEHQERVKTLTNWLQALESETYKEENSKAIGWDPSRLKRLYAANKQRLQRLNEEYQAVNTLLSIAKPGSSSSSSDVDSWNFLILHQRYTTLLLFTTDMDCILEERINILEKGNTENLYLSKEVWTERGLDLSSSCSITADDPTNEPTLKLH